MDADALPEPLTVPSFRRAMEVLKMFSQDRADRDYYEERLKIMRDNIDYENEKRALQAAKEQALEDLEQARSEREQARIEAEQMRSEAEQMRIEAEQMRSEAEQVHSETEQVRSEKEQMRSEKEQMRSEKEQMRGLARTSFVEQIRLCQQVLGRQVSDDSELDQLGDAALHDLAQQLTGEVKRRS